MARASPIFVCTACSGETLKWQGQCPLCGEWNSLEQRGASARDAAGRGAQGGAARPLAVGSPQRLDAALAGIEKRLASGHEELDRVMGGGIVPGSVTLLGGDPGIGKWTLLLKVAATAAGTNAVVYASGEESLSPARVRAPHLGLAGRKLEVIAERA